MVSDTVFFFFFFLLLFPAQVGCMRQALGPGVLADTVLNNQTSDVLLLFCRHKTNQENLLIFNYLFQFLLNI